MSAIRSVVSWGGPAALALVAGRVFAGDVAAPLVVLLLAVTPLAALVRADDAMPATPTHAALALPGVACVLAAHAVVVADFARLEGLPRAIAPVLTLVLAAAPLAPATAQTWRVTAAAGVAGAVVPIVIVAVVTSVSPWAAWNQVASRSALVFADRSEWVTEGHALAVATTLAFDESHRVTSVTPAVWHVIETDGTQTTSRERRLLAGDSVVLRPGDRLSMDAGARVRFERGKRVPGVVGSGVAWADPERRRGWSSLLVTLGATVTIAGAALALVGPARAISSRGALGAVTMPPVLALVAACFGVYAMYVSPEIALEVTPAAPLHDLPGAVLGAFAATPVIVVLGMALLALFAASAGTLAARVHETIVSVASRRDASGTGRRAEIVARGTWLAFGVIASAAALTIADGARLLLLGFGLLATTWTAPALAGAPRQASVAGAIAGVVVFFICAAAGWLSHPALVAAPVAWATAASLGRWRIREAGPSVAATHSR